MKLAEATELWLLERTRKLPSVVEELVLQQQRRGRRVLLRLHRVAALQGCVQDLKAVDVHRSSRLVGQARRLELRNSVWRHCEVHLGRAPGALVAHEAAVQGVVDVVFL